ncbi:MAG: ScyD/ScyE family protein [Chloroflexota bacterium]
MRRLQKRIIGKPVVAVTAALALAMMIGGLVAADEHMSPVATELERPRGLAVQDDGNLLVAEGAGGRILEVAPDGTVTEILTGIPTTTGMVEGQEETTGVSTAIEMDGTYYYVVGEDLEGDVDGMESLYEFTPGEDPELIADLGEYERANNTDDGTTPDGEPDLLSNPYDLVAAPMGGFFVSDAGANAVLHVTESGDITPYAIFPDRANPMSGTAGEPTMDVVPTGLEIGPDDSLYMTSLTGFPYPSGEARVYRITDLNGDGDATDGGEIRIFAQGLTTATDLAFDSDGSILVTEFSTDMLAEEPQPGRLMRYRAGSLSTVAEDLPSPTSVVVGEDENIYASLELAGIVARVFRPGDEPTPGDGTPTPPPATPAPSMDFEPSLPRTGGVAPTTGMALGVLIVGIVVAGTGFAYATRRKRQEG